MKFGIIGCGSIARRHANLLALGQVKDASLAAVCDLDESRANDFASNYNVEAFYNVQEMLSNGDIDAISILTPSGLHAKIIMEVAKYGKPIVVEKPLALKLRDADEVIEACDSYGVKLFVVKQNRFNLPIVKLRQAIEEGRFGQLVLGTVRIRWCRNQSYYDEAPWRGTWKHDGGVLTNQASHHIDLLVWMMGEVESVFAKTTTALANIEAEDTAVVVLKFSSGALGIIEATTATRPKDLEGSISILGEKGSVVIGGFAANKLETWQFENHKIEDDSIFSEYGENPSHPYGYAHQKFYEHVIECISEGKKQLIDGFAGRKSLELISAIYESVETGKEINLKFTPQRCRLGRSE
jgi:predicted dehydrogenase